MIADAIAIAVAYGAVAAFLANDIRRESPKVWDGDEAPWLKALMVAALPIAYGTVLVAKRGRRQ